MAYYCAYKDCEEIKRTFSKKSFFQLYVFLINIETDNFILISYDICFLFLKTMYLTLDGKCTTGQPMNDEIFGFGIPAIPQM